jgi:hypothetical protein
MKAHTNHEVFKVVVFCPFNSEISSCSWKDAFKVLRIKFVKTACKQMQQSCQLALLVLYSLLLN